VANSTTLYFVGSQEKKGGKERARKNSVWHAQREGRGVRFLFSSTGGGEKREVEDLREGGRGEGVQR